MSWDSGTHAIDLDNKSDDWGTDDGSYANFFYQNSQLVTDDTDTGKQNEFVSKVSKGGPSYSKCANPVATNYVYALNIRNADKNAMYCAKTPGHRYSAIRLLKDWSSPDKIIVTIVTWERP